MEALLVFFTGVLFGLVLALLAYLMFKEKPVGTLRVDRSDPDGPYLFLELHEDVSTVLRSEYITLKVDARSYISRD